VKITHLTRSSTFHQLRAVGSPTYIATNKLLKLLQNGADVGKTVMRQQQPITRVHCDTLTAHNTASALLMRLIYCRN